MELANSCFLEKDRHQDRDLPGDRAKRIHLVGHGPDAEGYDLYTRADQRNAVINHARPNDAFDDDVGAPSQVLPHRAMKSTAIQSPSLNR